MTHELTLSDPQPSDHAFKPIKVLNADNLQEFNETSGICLVETCQVNEYEQGAKTFEFNYEIKGSDATDPSLVDDLPAIWPLTVPVPTTYEEKCSAVLEIEDWQRNVRSYADRCGDSMDRGVLSLQVWTTDQKQWDELTQCSTRGSITTPESSHNLIIMEPDDLDT